MPPVPFLPPVGAPPDERVPLDPEAPPAAVPPVDPPSLPVRAVPTSKPELQPTDPNRRSSSIAKRGFKVRVGMHNPRAARRIKQSACLSNLPCIMLVDL